MGAEQGGRFDAVIGLGQAGIGVMNHPNAYPLRIANFYTGAQAILEVETRPKLLITRTGTREKRGADSDLNEWFVETVTKNVFEHRSSRDRVTIAALPAGVAKIPETRVRRLRSLDCIYR